MHPQFSQLTLQWFKRAFNYTGSIGDFRYRYLMEKDRSAIHMHIFARIVRSCVFLKLSGL